MKRLLPFALATLALFVAGCANLPRLDGRQQTTAIADTSDTRLGCALAAVVQASRHPTEPATS